MDARERLAIGLAVATALILIFDVWSSGPRRRRRPGNDELPEGPHLQDPQTERWDASSQGRPPETWVHPMESESCEIDELVPSALLSEQPEDIVCLGVSNVTSSKQCDVPDCGVWVPTRRAYCAVHETIRREIRDGDYPELETAVEKDVRAFAWRCRSN